LKVKFEITHDGEFWCASATNEGIFTQGETLDELFKNIREAAALHFGENLDRGEEIKIIVVSETSIEPLSTKG